MIPTIAVHLRMAKSLDFLGSDLKVVAGIPDAHDLEFTDGMLVESNNRQIVVKIQAQINSFADTVNKILSKFKETNSEYENLLKSNIKLTTEIENLMLTISLAKPEIINLGIYDHAGVQLTF